MAAIKRGFNGRGPMAPAKTARMSSTAQSNTEVKIVEFLRNWNLTICARSPVERKIPLGRYQEMHLRSACDFHESDTPKLQKFRVNTIVVLLLSPAFERMLNGPFLESQASEIMLEDDHPEALAVLFAIAHHKRSELPDSLSIHVLLELAILAGKYDVVGLVRPVVTRLFSYNKWAPLHGLFIS